MPEQKLIFLDIDGTLLPPGEMVAPDSAIAAVRRAQAVGHKVFLCTGRNYRMTAPLLDLGFDGFVCSAGGYVGCGDQILVDLPLPAQQVQGLCEVLEKNGVECTLEARDDTFGGQRMLRRFETLLNKPGRRLNSEAERWRTAMKQGMTLRPLSDYQGQPVYKVVYIAPDEASLAEARRQYEHQFFFCESCMELTSSVINGELIDRRFSKGEGIRAICRYLERPLSDTIGFGDSDNDLAMADVVGISVCMANGSESLKQRCQRICPAVTEDGIARAFAELGLG